MRNLWFITLSILLMGSLNGRAEQMITVIFRCDDYGDTSPSKIAVLLYEVFEEHNAPLTLGVVPFNKHKKNPETRRMNPFKVDLMARGRTNGVFDVALHGYTHSHRSPIERDSEFRGLPLKEQYRLISTGVSNLEQIVGYPIKTFVPPWHSFDTNTLLAMKQAGMTCLSIGFDIFPFTGLADTDLLNLQCLPEGCNIWNIHTHLKKARNSGDPAPILMVLLHDYDFKASKTSNPLTCEFLSEVLATLQSQPDVHIRSISATLPDSTAYTIKHLIELVQLQDQLNRFPRLTKLLLQDDPKVLLPKGILSSPAHLQQIKLRIARRLMVMIGGICLVLLGGIFFVRRRRFLILDS